jgi:hypothetical protein
MFLAVLLFPILNYADLYRFYPYCILCLSDRAFDELQDSKDRTKARNITAIGCQTKGFNFRTLIVISIAMTCVFLSQIFTKIDTARDLATAGANDNSMEALLCFGQ